MVTVMTSVPLSPSVLKAAQTPIDALQKPRLKPIAAVMLMLAMN